MKISGTLAASKMTAVNSTLVRGRSGLQPHASFVVSPPKEGLLKWKSKDRSNIWSHLQAPTASAFFLRVFFFFFSVKAANQNSVLASSLVCSVN